MLIREFDEVKWLEFELLEDCPLVHGCFTRQGGQSEGALSSLNLGSKVDDRPENVAANRQKVQRALTFSTLITAKACHGASVVDVSENEPQLPWCDALSTKLPGKGLLVTQADCQAAIFYDPIQHAIANVHCGWRGNVQNIYGETVAHMQHCYGSKAADLLVCISPSLGPKNSQFLNYQTELPQSFWEFKTHAEYFDLWAISEWQLLNLGVLSHHIQIAKIDTYSNREDYFSYRRLKICGRQGTVCALKKK